MSMSDEDFEPPKTFDECLDHMNQGMEKHIKMEEGAAKAMVSCAKESVFLPFPLGTDKISDLLSQTSGLILTAAHCSLNCAF